MLLNNLDTYIIYIELYFQDFVLIDKNENLGMSN